MTAAGSARPGLAEDATVEVGPLAYRCEHGCWTVGSLDTGEAVDLPGIAVTVLHALESGKNLDQAALDAEEAHGERPDVRGFVEELSELGFVRLPGQRPHEPAEPGGLAFGWLAPRYVSWAFSPASGIVITAFILAAFGLAIGRHRLGFGYGSFFASRYPGVSLAWSVGVVTLSMLLHEFWHLAAARAAGIPARIKLSTRLIFLVAQTAAPLMWLASRRQRLCFYLAGMTCDLALAAAFAVVCTWCRAGTWPAAMAGSATLMLLLGVVYEFAFCMRTDVYLVAQELLRCRNLSGDARAYARYRVRRTMAAVRGQHPPADPTLELPRHERQPVRLYAAFLVAGCAVVLALTAAYGLPITVALYLRAARGVASAQPWRVLDGLATFGVEAGTQALFIVVAARRLRRRRAAR